MFPDGAFLVSYIWEKELLLSKFLPNGQLDSAFANGGQRKVAIGLFKYTTAPLLLEDGKITISGMVVRPPAEGKSQPPYYYSFGLARFLSDGRADSVLGADGMITLPIGAVNDHANTLIALGKGRVLLVGSSSDDQNDSQLLLLGFTP
jgi:hypothetical protein